MSREEPLFLSAHHGLLLTLCALALTLDSPGTGQSGRLEG